MYKCVFCDSNIKRIQNLTFNCPICTKYSIFNQALELPEDIKEKRHLISGYIREMNELKKDIGLLNSRTLKRIIQSELIPRNKEEQLNKVLNYFYRKTKKQDRFQVKIPFPPFSVGYAKDNDDMLNILNELINRGFIKSDSEIITNESTTIMLANYYLTLEGEKYIEKINHQLINTNQSQVQSNKKNYKYDVFISYSSKDFSIIQKVINDFKNNNITYWIDIEQIEPGDHITPQIEKALNNSRYVMPCFSRNQLKSGWSRVEYSAILHKTLSTTSCHQKVVPLIIDDLEPNELPLLTIDILYTKLSDSRAYQKLLDFLKNK